MDSYFRYIYARQFRVLLTVGKAQPSRFFRATVYGRLLFFVLTIFVTVYMSQSAALAGIGSIDLIGALITGYYLRKLPKGANGIEHR